MKPGVESTGERLAEGIRALRGMSGTNVISTATREALREAMEKQEKELSDTRKLLIEAYQELPMESQVKYRIAILLGM
jgi:hypothetical protein